MRPQNKASQQTNETIPYNDREHISIDTMINHMNAVGFSSNDMKDILSTVTASADQIIPSNRLNKIIDPNGLLGLVRASLVNISEHDTELPLNNTPHTRQSQPTLRRRNSSPALLQGRERLNSPVSALRDGDEELIAMLPIHGRGYFLNLEAMSRHMNNIGIHINHIDNIIWDTLFFTDTHDPQYLDHDLLDAQIEHRGYNALLRASFLPHNYADSAPVA